MRKVLAEQLGHVFRPVRDLSHRNYLSEADFPEEVLPALALGNFYVLSADLARSIAQNISGTIHPVGTLEDLSVAVWMKQQQV
jgi:Galactosyltransferase